MKAKVLVIACGAIAKELVRIKTLNNWDHVEFQCLPAALHNRPGDIPAAVREKIESQASLYQKIFVAYADCGTGGQLDRVLDEYGVERIPGAHCYEFYSGRKQFQEIADAEPCTFYLTDFLTRHFERLVIKGLGLDRHPQLLPVYFGNYKRLLYIAQTDSEKLQTMASGFATYLGLEYEYRFTGDQPLELVLAPALEQKASNQKVINS